MCIIIMRPVNGTSALSCGYTTKVLYWRQDRLLCPGSMGTKSYIGLGLENPESFCSCSHGAGRVLGRSQAKRTISADKVIRELEARDIVLCKTKMHDVAEESPAVYKDIDKVMLNQNDLVKIQVALKPLGVVKG